MSQYNPMEETYDPVDLFDKPALFTNLRIDRATVPPGLYAYDIRHDDEGRVATIENHVRVNHMGTVITAEPTDLGAAGYIEYGEDNYFLNFAGSHDCTTIPEYTHYLSELQQAQGEEPGMAQEMA